MRGVKKRHLPEKPCARCDRPMRWRRRWAAVWDEVRYCSERCRRQPQVKRNGLSGRAG